MKTDSDKTGTRDAERTKADIVRVATQHFARYGMAGARVDRIAEETHTSKRMIYYYFNSKAGLYSEVLRQNYRHIRSLEAGFDLEKLDPVQAIHLLVKSTLEHYDANPELVQIVVLENILMKGKVLEQQKDMHAANQTIVELISEIMHKGLEAGIFHYDPHKIDAIDVHAVITALIFFRITDQYSFNIAFDRDLLHDKTPDEQTNIITRTTLGMLGADLSQLPY